MAWDAMSLYGPANFALAAAHLVLAGVLARIALKVPHVRAVRFVCWPLAAFFLTGVPVHCLYALVPPPDGPDLSWSVLARSALAALAVAPLTVYGAAELKALPTRAAYDDLFREKDETAAGRERALAEKDAALKLAVTAQAEADRLRRRAEDVARKVAGECDHLRAEVEHLRYRHDLRAQADAMRVSIHEIRNALPAVLPARPPPEGPP